MWWGLTPAPRDPFSAGTEAWTQLPRVLLWLCHHFLPGTAPVVGLSPTWGHSALLHGWRGKVGPAKNHTRSLLSRTPCCCQDKSQWPCSCDRGQRGKACFVLPGEPCTREMKKLQIPLHLPILLREIKAKARKPNQAPAVSGWSPHLISLFLWDPSVQLSWLWPSQSRDQCTTGTVGRAVGNQDMNLAAAGFVEVQAEVIVTFILSYFLNYELEIFF